MTSPDRMGEVSMSRFVVVVGGGDSPWNQAFTQQCMVRGFTVRHFDGLSPDEVRTLRPVPDCVVLAIPGGDESSLNLINRWRVPFSAEELGDSPFVVVTGSDFDRVFARSINAGAKGVYPKSVDPHNLDLLTRSLAVLMDTSR